ncbi:hypothetical protein BJ138DRAFT_1120258 [Hygrophoropsis aurantiaca]|uniref:Uncharacterized protein n=1 Tax=Hygrophoropsis aurantiaca TaxID=72124 RepID=A0ACB7ZS34_9AGAM|nr:hypothetical protein BJ138DRAFT_1120258 [Hygrophoropsis aurantiaca]
MSDFIDQFYDKQAAIGSIIKSKDILSGNQHTYPLEEMSKDEHILSKVEVTFSDNPASWRICTMTKDGMPEEMVFSLTGVIVAKNLPPITSRPAINRAQLIYLKQAITLTGFGTSAFSQALDGADLAYYIFAHHFKEGTLLPWQHSCSQSCLDYPSIDASNRYFLLRSQNPTSISHPFQPMVDPKSILTNLAKDELIHTEENGVYYFKVQTANPATFRVGDVVEAQITFCAWPTKGEKFTMTSVLRSLTLLDGSHSLRAALARK